MVIQSLPDGTSVDVPGGASGRVAWDGPRAALLTFTSPRQVVVVTGSDMKEVPLPTR